MPDPLGDSVGLVATFIEQRAKIGALERQLVGVSVENASLRAANTSLHTVNASLRDDNASFRMEAAKRGNETRFSFVKDPLTGDTIMEGHNGGVQVEDYKFKMGRAK